jgi:hypothetical protein
LKENKVKSILCHNPHPYMNEGKKREREKETERKQERKKDRKRAHGLLLLLLLLLLHRIPPHYPPRDPTCAACFRRNPAYLCLLSDKTRALSTHSKLPFYQFTTAGENFCVFFVKDPPKIQRQQHHHHQQQEGKEFRKRGTKRRK